MTAGVGLLGVEFLDPPPEVSSASPSDLGGGFMRAGYHYGEGLAKSLAPPLGMVGYQFPGRHDHQQ